MDLQSSQHDVKEPIKSLFLRSDHRRVRPLRHLHHVGSSRSRWALFPVYLPLLKTAAEQAECRSGRRMVSCMVTVFDKLKPSAVFCCEFGVE